MSDLEALGRRERVGAGHLGRQHSARRDRSLGPSDRGTFKPM
jgi:hypothetical protein